MKYVLVFAFLLVIIIPITICTDNIIDGSLYLEHIIRDDNDDTPPPTVRPVDNEDAVIFNCLQDPFQVVEEEDALELNSSCWCWQTLPFGQAINACGQCAGIQPPQLLSLYNVMWRVFVLPVATTSIFILFILIIANVISVK
jgi:hypothetical protein